MKTTFRLIVGLLLLGGWALSAAALHLVIVPGRVVVVPKDRLGINETVVDARQWTLPDAAAHPLVVQRLIATHNADVLGHVTKSGGYDDLAAQLDAAVRDAKVAAPTTQMARHG